MYGIIFREDGLISVGSRLYSNKNKVPMEIVSAILKDRYTVEGEESSDYSASVLVQPVQKTILEKRYKWESKKKEDHKLKIFDVMDDFWSFLGSVAHQVLEEAWHENMGGVVEERLYVDVCGERLSGKMDRYIDGQIRDYKNTKVYKIQRGDYQDWAIQQNIYAHLCRENGWPVGQIQIVALLGDWKEMDTYKSGYPPSAVHVIPIRVWGAEAIRDWIEDRIQRLQKAIHLPDKDLATSYPCSDSERWKNYKGTAVMKKGGQKASYLVKPEDNDDMAMAYRICEEWIKAKKNADEYVIEVRWSEPKRCTRFCAASTICQQWADDPANKKEEELK